MASTTAGINTQLTTAKQSQTDNATPSLETRKLAALLEGTIHYYRKDLFYTRLELGADINFSGLDDKNEYVDPPLITAILFANAWAFDELLRRGANVHNGGEKSSPPLFIAASQGNMHMVRALLAKGANPLDYRKGTCLPLMLETIHSNALFESASRWRYEDESPDSDNAALKQQISDFFLQEGAYIPPKPSVAIPFGTSEHVIHAYYEGKLEILGELLARHVSPTIPVSGTTRSPLELVQNPAKHPGVFRADPGEKLEYIGTEAENPNVLLFKMRFRNKRNTGTAESSPLIIVHYDFESARHLIEGALAHSPQVHAVTQSLASKVEQDLRETESRLDTQLSTAENELKAKLEAAQTETARLQARLTAAQDETKHLAETVNGVGEAVKKVDRAVQDVRAATHADEIAEIKRFKAFIKSHPNAEEAYNTILSRLKSIHKSAQAVDGGGVVVSEGSLGLVAKVFDVSTEVVDSIPLIGSAASKLFGLAASATRQVDETRQTNIYENIAAMVPATGAGRIFESVARKLTLAYLPQFERLQTREEAQPQGNTTTLAQSALKSRFKSPAERTAAFAVVFMIEDVFNNMHALEKELKKPNGLETLLLNAVMQRKPEQSVATFWNTVTAKLGINQVPTRTPSGSVSTETWALADFWTMPGVKVEGSHSAAVEYFAGNNTNPSKFGWRFGTSTDVDAIGLMPATETGLLEPVEAVSTRTRATAMPTAAPCTPRGLHHAYAPAPATSSTSTPRRQEPYETKVALDVPPPPPSTSNRSRSPFGGALRFPGFGSRRTPITTS